MAFDVQRVADKLINEISSSVIEIEGLVSNVSERLERLSDTVWEVCKSADSEICILDVFERIRLRMLEGLDQKARLRRANVLNALRRRVIQKWRAEHAEDSKTRTISLKRYFLDEAKVVITAFASGDKHTSKYALIFALRVIRECARAKSRVEELATEALDRLVASSEKDDVLKVVHEPLQKLSNLLRKG